MAARLNIALCIAIVVVVALTWMLRRDFTERNLELLPGMVESVPSDAFAPNQNFPDGKTLQAPPPGTIPRSFTPVHYAATPEDAIRAGKELRSPFMQDSVAAIERGRNVFATFCQPCHGAGGLGDGPVVLHGFPPPPSLLAEKAMKLQDGQIFHIITYGQGNMPSLASQIAPLDRWRAVLHVRSLQTAQKPVAQK